MQRLLLIGLFLSSSYVLKHVFLDHNQLTDETGVKLAQYLVASSTIYSLVLSQNQLGSATYLALAAALRVNSSLQRLYRNGNQAVDRTRIDAVFVETLRLNPVRPTGSIWWLYPGDWDCIDYKRLQDAASELGHPSLQQLLADDQLAATLQL